MRPAASLAALFAVLSATTLVLGALGAFENAPGVWTEGWQTLVVVHGALALLLGYYVTRSS